MTVFEVKSIVARHDLLIAVREVSFAVEQGEVMAIVGANGAGKTTLFRTLAGVHPAAAGTIVLEGKDVTALPAHLRVRSGIALSPEGRRLFSDMTVVENLTVAGENGRMGKWTLHTVMAAFPQLAAVAKSPAGNLSGGQRQTVAIARALMSNPKVLLLDEASLGLSPLAIERLYENLEALKSTRETTIILVEQDLDRAITFSDRLVCMLEGRVQLAGRSDELSRSSIADAYFGLSASFEEP